jgi:hypothetical protein
VGQVHIEEPSKDAAEQRNHDMLAKPSAPRALTITLRKLAASAQWIVNSRNNR